MEQTTIWGILLAVFVALSVGLAIALAAVSYALRNRKKTGREVHVEYLKPDYTRSAGFQLVSLPDDDILTPTRYWLVDGEIAEVEYAVAYSNDVTFRVAPVGNLQVPEKYAGFNYQSLGSYNVGDVDVTLQQSPGQASILNWSKNGFDYAVFAPGSEMNLMGGVSQQFVTESNAVYER